MAKSELFDCIGHFDLIKLWDKEGKFFNQDEKWYAKEVLDVLEDIKRYNICIEINTSGLRKCNEQYPSFWILKEMNKRKIPITIGSDAHKKEELNQGLEKAIDLAKKAGYKSILKFRGRKPIKIEI